MIYKQQVLLWVVLLQHVLSLYCVFLAPTGPEAHSPKNNKIYIHCNNKCFWNSKIIAKTVVIYYFILRIVAPINPSLNRPLYIFLSRMPMHSIKSSTICCQNHRFVVKINDIQTLVCRCRILSRAILSTFSFRLLSAITSVSGKSLRNKYNNMSKKL